MSQIQTFSPTTAGCTPAPLTRRAMAFFPEKSGPGVSMRLLKARLRAWRLRRAERKAIQSLLHASDHLLDDIGIGRHDVHEMLRNL